MSNGMPEASSALPIDSTDVWPDSLRDALGQVIADLRRQWRLEHELMGAQAQATIEQLRSAVVVANATISELRAAAATRLAELHDGAPGAPGERGVAGKQGERGQDGEQGPQGKQGEIGMVGPAGIAGPQGDRGETGAQGEKGDKGDPGESLVGPQGQRGPEGAAGRDGTDGQPGAKGDAGITGDPGPAGPEGKLGPAGERGEQGPPGLLPIVKLYVPDAVHYLGDVVSHGGSTWQARRDTGQAPPHRDWICLAAAARVLHIRGTYKAEEVYGALDVIMKESSSHVALKDDPGPCPGPGWQLLAAAGRRGVAGETGIAGERGPKGEPGAKGEAGPRLASWYVDRKTYRAIARMSDGSEVPLELHDLFEQFHSETK